MPHKVCVCVYMFMCVYVHPVLSETNSTCMEALRWMELPPVPKASTSSFQVTSYTSTPATMAAHTHTHLHDHWCGWCLSYCVCVCACVAAGCWEKLLPSGPAPQTLSSTTVVSAKYNKLITFGGISNGVAQQSLYYLNLCESCH